MSPKTEFLKKKKKIPHRNRTNGRNSTANVAELSPESDLISSRRPGQEDDDEKSSITPTKTREVVAISAINTAGDGLRRQFVRHDRIA